MGKQAISRTFYVPFGGVKGVKGLSCTVEWAWSFCHIKDAKSSPEWIADNGAFPHRYSEWGDQDAASLLCKVGYSLNYMINKVVNFYGGWDAGITVEHNFGIGLRKYQSNRVIATPLGGYN